MIIKSQISMILNKPTYDTLIVIVSSKVVIATKSIVELKWEERQMGSCAFLSDEINSSTSEKNVRGDFVEKVLEYLVLDFAGFMKRSEALLIHPTTDETFAWNRGSGGAFEAGIRLGFSQYRECKGDQGNGCGARKKCATTEVVLLPSCRGDESFYDVICTREVNETGKMINCDTTCEIRCHRHPSGGFELAVHQMEWRII
ncbi:hypothetical protein EGR_04575 [Echinococcus granulosus]|uniref:Uncharacterized protein n=1 Tax=Echinococcus granulosus TaxID=6210 RepID=W6UHM2_ECHGR|nr:hypothetical protein EGR_04575 [Echinococcus granulosus]EUB60556.1 hypothetical protein EGR_04575 [Echinococcus granulosus]